MVDVVNVFICLAAPLTLTLVLLKGEARRFNLFLIIGMSIGLAASYVNDFLITLTTYTAVERTIYISPISEEILKATPVLFYVLVFKPEKHNIILSALAIGIGFATLENCCYITAYGTSDLLFALIRGFSSGIMHAVCTAIVGYGLCFAYNKQRLDYITTFGLLSVVITYHSIYNMFVSSPIGLRVIGCLIPIITALIIIIIMKKEILINIITKIRSLRKKEIS